MKKTKLGAIVSIVCLAATFAAAGDQLYTMPAEDFFKLKRVQEPLDPARIDSNLLAAAIFHETNRRREKQGLKPLGHSPGLQSAADLHARSMATGGYLSHNEPGDPARRTPLGRVKLSGLQPTFVAENVASHFGLQYESGAPFYIIETGDRVEFSSSPGGPPLPRHTYATFSATLLDQWMASPEHRGNILSPQARSLGAAAMKQVQEGPRSIQKYYCVQVFGAP